MKAHVKADFFLNFVKSAHMSRGTVFEFCSLLLVPVDMCNGLVSSTAAGRVAPVQYRANAVDCRALFSHRIVCNSEKVCLVSLHRGWISSSTFSNAGMLHF